jgi:hypothetical protein
MTLSIMTNLAMCLLLVAGIVLGIVLMRRLAILRAAQGELAAMGETLAVAAAKAEAGLAELRKAAEADGDALQERATRARALKDDLSFLVDRAGEAAARLEGPIGEARKSGRSRPPLVSRPPLDQPVPTAPKLRSAAGRRIMAGGERTPEAPGNDGGGSSGLPPAGEQLLRALQGMR